MPYSVEVFRRTKDLLALVISRPPSGLLFADIGRHLSRQKLRVWLPVNWARSAVLAARTFRPHVSVLTLTQDT